MGRFLKDLNVNSEAKSLRAPTLAHTLSVHYLVPLPQACLTLTITAIIELRNHNRLVLDLLSCLQKIKKALYRLNMLSKLLFLLRSTATGVCVSHSLLASIFGTQWAIRDIAYKLMLNPHLQNTIFQLADRK